MVKGPPDHDLLAESLCWTRSVDRHDKSRAAHLSNPFKVTRQVCPQNLGCDLPTLMLTLPHIRKPAMGHRILRWIVGERNFQRSRKQSLAATYPV